MAEEWFQSELTALIKDVIPHMQSAEFPGLMDFAMKMVNLSRGMQMHLFCAAIPFWGMMAFMQKCWHLGRNYTNLIFAFISINFRLHKSSQYTCNPGV